MQLEAVTRSLHAFETLLQDLRERKQRKGGDLLPVTVRVKALYGEVAAIQEVIAQSGTRHRERSNPTASGARCRNHRAAGARPPMDRICPATGQEA